MLHPQHPPETPTLWHLWPRLRLSKLPRHRALNTASARHVFLCNPLQFLKAHAETAKGTFPHNPRCCLLCGRRCYVGFPRCVSCPGSNAGLGILLLLGTSHASELCLFKKLWRSPGVSIAGLAKLCEEFPSRSKLTAATPAPGLSAKSAHLHAPAQSTQGTLRPSPHTKPPIWATAQGPCQIETLSQWHLRHSSQAGSVQT